MGSVELGVVLATPVAQTDNIVVNAAIAREVSVRIVPISTKNGCLDEGNNAQKI